MLSIKEISRQTGFSTATVSRALDPHHCGKVKASTRKRIMKLCDEYRFRPKFSAQALASGKTFTVGLISTDLESMMHSPTYSQFVSFLAQELKNCNYTLSVLPVSDCDPETIDREILHTFYSCRVDGFILSSGSVGALTLRELVTGQFPVVTYQMPSDVRSDSMPVSCVRIDSGDAYRNLLLHLCKTGRKHPVILGVEDQNPRYDLCRKCSSELTAAMQTPDLLPLSREEIRIEPMFGTYLAVLRHWERLRTYDAWIVSNDLMALGACAALRHFHYEPGEEIAVCGYDNIEESRAYLHWKPELTTIRPPLDRLASTCAQLLLEQIAAHNTCRREIILDAELIVRQSSRSENGSARWDMEDNGRNMADNSGMN